MTARQLLRFYPRAWRERYGDEFLEIAGPAPITLQQTIDIVSGAIDAWLSADVRTATRAASTAGPGGSTMTVKTMLCRTDDVRYTSRDSLIGAAVMIGVTAALVALATALKYSGWEIASRVILEVAFFAAMAISLPFWLMKGQPWRAQTLVIGGTLLLLVAISWLAVVT